MPDSLSTPSRAPLLAVSALFIAATLLTLWMMGRIPICDCGTMKLWAGPANTQETSQQLSDFYTLSHISHGFLFYAALWLVAPRLSIASRFLIALGIECGWEIFENTSFIIDRYREQTISYSYYGDSLFNSFGDILAMALGFLAAARLPVWSIIAMGLGFEVLAAVVIRDNLTLNIIMLLWPLDAIKEWQAGG